MDPAGRGADRTMPSERRHPYSGTGFAGPQDKDALSGSESKRLCLGAWLVDFGQEKLAG